MLYIEYEEAKKKYNKARERYTKLLDQKEKLLSIALPKATDYSKDVVGGGTPTNSFDTYLISEEKAGLDKKLEEALSILQGREILLKTRKEELYDSKDLWDRIYVYKFIEHLTAEKIKNKTNYSIPQIYRILKKIKKNVR